MPVYTLARYCGSPEPDRVECEDYVDDADALADARAALLVWSVGTDNRPLSVAVGRGQEPDVEWLGAWELDGLAPAWTPGG